MVRALLQPITGRTSKGTAYAAGFSSRQFHFGQVKQS
jgi:hypothetical protein